jgi:quinol-cytochrome oxidoreductase complex cytochrome b subunit
MVVQVGSGFLLALYYTDCVRQAFISVNYIIVEVEGGNLIRFIHSRGARLLFFLVFIHMGRGLWYKSYHILEVWQVGVVIFLVLIGVSFLGYVLPWGQMSF